MWVEVLLVGFYLFGGFFVGQGLSGVPLEENIHEGINFGIKASRLTHFGGKLLY